MIRISRLAALPLLIGLAAPTGAAVACAFHDEASRAPVVVADNAATSTPAPAGAAGKTDTTAFPNSPNGSPAAGDKGAPVVTDKAACSGTTAAKCPDAPAPSTKADTSDTKVATPTTVGGKAAP